ncbi:hypothetical protein ACFQV4_33455 [Streptomyces thermocarboxydus]
MATTAAPMPGTARSSSRSSGGKGQSVREWASAAASTASHSAVRVSRTSSSSTCPGPLQSSNAPRACSGWKHTATKPTVSTLRVTGSRDGPSPRPTCGTLPSSEAASTTVTTWAAPCSAGRPATSPSSAYASEPAAASGAGSRMPRPPRRVSSPTATSVPKARAVERSSTPWYSVVPSDPAARTAAHRCTTVCSGTVRARGLTGAPRDDR